MGHKTPIICGLSQTFGQVRMYQGDQQPWPTRMLNMMMSQVVVVPDDSKHWKYELFAHTYGQDPPQLAPEGSPAFDVDPHQATSYSLDPSDPHQYVYALGKRDADWLYTALSVLGTIADVQTRLMDDWHMCGRALIDMYEANNRVWPLGTQNYYQRILNLIK
jgi:hypothetical protein